MGNLKDNKIIGFPIIQNQQDFVIAKFSIKQIFSFTKYTERILNSFDENGNPIYNDEIQREIELDRVKKIADFLIEDPEATFPTNLVFHIPSEAIQEQKESHGIVEIILNQRVFDELAKSNGDVFITIIDGQHRIKGIEMALNRIKEEILELSKVMRTGGSGISEINKKHELRTQRLRDLENIELVVSFFIDKTIEYQAMIFSTINRTQKRVSQSLVYDLFGLNTNDSPQKTAIQIIIRLNGHKNSPFYNRIKFYGGTYSLKSSPPLTQAGMAKSIVDLISENLRESERDRFRSRKELQKRAISSNRFLPFRIPYATNRDHIISDLYFYFFNSVKEAFVDNQGNSLWEMSSGKPSNILHTTVGYETLLKVMVEIIHVNYDSRQLEQMCNKEFFLDYLSKCNFLQIDNISRYPFNNRGKKILYLDMSLAIWPSSSDINDKRISELEKLFRNPYEEN